MERDDGYVTECRSPGDGRVRDEPEREPLPVNGYAAAAAGAGRTCTTGGVSSVAAAGRARHVRQTMKAPQMSSTSAPATEPATMPMVVAERVDDLAAAGGELAADEGGPGAGARLSDTEASLLVLSPGSC